MTQLVVENCVPAFIVENCVPAFVIENCVPGFVDADAEQFVGTNCSVACNG